MNLLSPLCSPRIGTTLIEIMIALMILATGILVVFGHIANVKNLQGSTQAHELATMAANNLANLYAGAAVSEISAWNLPGSGFALARTDDVAWSTLPDLVARGVVAPNSTGLFDKMEMNVPVQLEFAVGFYRVLQNTNSQGGLVSGLGFYGVQEPTRVSSVTDPLYLVGLSTAENRERRAPFVIDDVANTTEVSSRKPIGILIQVQGVDQVRRTTHMIRTQLSMVGTP